MSKDSPAGLTAIQNLYVIAIELTNLVSKGLRTPTQVDEAKKHLRDFSALLKVADPGYMGGEDVYEEFQVIHQSIKEKINERASVVKERAGKKPGKAQK